MNPESSNLDYENYRSNNGWA